MCFICGLTPITNPEVIKQLEFEVLRTLGFRIGGDPLIGTFINLKLHSQEDWVK